MSSVSISGSPASKMHRPFSPWSGRLANSRQIGAAAKPQVALEAAKTPARASRDLVAEYVAGVLPADALTRLEDRCDLTGATRIGSGSIGDVISATDRFTGKRVAVKVISIEKMRASGAEEACLRREIEALKRVQHPNIVRYVDVLYSARTLPCVPPLFADRPPPYVCIAMEHIPGSQPLSALIRQRGPQPALARKLLPQLGGALKEMHDKGFAHRDVWSENVLMDTEGYAFLVDFGCAARFLPGAPSVENRMNVPYMSPQASARERQQKGDDCWALGCLLTEVVTGKFVADRIGRSDIPLHKSRIHLQNAIRDTYSLGDKQLGDTAAALLDRRVETRLQMADLCKKSGGIPGSPLSHMTVHSGASSVSTAASLKDVMVGRGDPNFCNVGISSQKNPAALSGAHRQPVVASGALSSGHEVQRSRPQSVQLDRGAALSASTRAVPPRTSRLSASGISEQVTARSAAAGSDARVAQVPSSVAAPVPGYPVQEAALLFAPGMPVDYTARSHAGEYKAIIIGREPGRQAWRIRVEQGGEKVVEDAEVWRLKRPVASRMPSKVIW